MRTEQETFDFVSEMLFKQGVKSAEDRGRDGNPYPINSCLYRGPKGSKCAIGWQIPDELYKANMEYKGLRTLLKAYPVLCTHISFPALQSDLQMAHDELMPNIKGQSLCKWKTEMCKIAEMYNLNINQWIRVKE